MVTFPKFSVLNPQGFKLKDKIKQALEKSKRTVEDVGVSNENENVL